MITVKEIKTKARRMFLAANPGARVVWVKQPRFITYPTGYRGFRGEFKATQEGYRTRIMVAECDRFGFNMSVR